ncbi:MAG: BON domain-containing protein [Acidobacteria bacterium]|nr:BON domain-containing protein [Acidobacteriota bacterium]
MSQDEERQRRSRVVVETPTARREEVYTQTRRVPPERSGVSTGVVAAVALTAVALTAIVVFFLMNSGEDATRTGVNINATAATPIPTVPTPFVVQQATPLMTPPPQTIIVQPAPGTTTTQPVVVPPTTTAPVPESPVLRDADIESNVNKSLTDDSQIGPLGITVTVTNGRVTLNGQVATADLKARAERLARAIRGVSGIDNKIVVEAPPE